MIRATVKNEDDTTLFDAVYLHGAPCIGEYLWVTGGVGEVGPSSFVITEVAHWIAPDYVPADNTPIHALAIYVKPTKDVATTAKVNDSERRMSAEELKGKRKAMHLSQQELGDKIGMSRVTICEMEAGRAPIEKRTAMAIRYLTLLEMTS